MRRIFFLLLLFVSGCATSNHFLIYEAKPSNNIYTFYSNGIPITSIKNENFFVLLSTEETYLLHKTYLRVWILYQNNSESPVILEPYNLATLTGQYKGKTLNFYPQSPTEILDAIDEQKNAALILQSIGGALKELSTNNTTISGNNGTRFEVNDQEEKRNAVNEQTQRKLSNISNWYNIFESSFNNGVLRKNTVFPHNSVNGYIYIPLPDIRGSKDWGGVYNYNIDELQFTVNLKINNVNKVIEIKPTKVW